MNKEKKKKKDYFLIVYYTPPCLGGHRQVFYMKDSRFTFGQSKDYSKGIRNYTIPKSAWGFPFEVFVEKAEDITYKDKQVWRGLDKRYYEQEALLKIRFES